jgi:hypothetical protein
MDGRRREEAAKFEKGPSPKEQVDQTEPAGIHCFDSVYIDADLPSGSDTTVEDFGDKIPSHEITSITDEYTSAGD